MEWKESPRNPDLPNPPKFFSPNTLLCNFSSIVPVVLHFSRILLPPTAGGGAPSSCVSRSREISATALVIIPMAAELIRRRHVETLHLARQTGIAAIVGDGGSGRSGRSRGREAIRLLAPENLSRTAALDPGDPFEPESAGNALGEDDTIGAAPPRHPALLHARLHVCPDEHRGIAPHAAQHGVTVRELGAGSVVGEGVNHIAAAAIPAVAAARR